ncbi:hypothetical protein IJF81_04075 [bacterium]|nr:hypothetical protein [bacterium]
MSFNWNKLFNIGQALQAGSASAMQAGMQARQWQFMQNMPMMGMMSPYGSVFNYGGGYNPLVFGATNPYNNMGLYNNPSFTDEIIKKRVEAFEEACKKSKEDASISRGGGLYDAFIRLDNGRVDATKISTKSKNNDNDTYDDAFSKFSKDLLNFIDNKFGDKDGKVSEYEWDKFLKDRGITNNALSFNNLVEEDEYISSTRLSEGLKNADVDGDGQITKEEYKAWKTGESLETDEKKEEKEHKT